MSLVDQLSNQAKSTIPLGIDVNQWIYQYNRNFARLVVEQCALVADREYRNPAGCGWITKTVGDRIKEHFGVSDE